MKMLRTLTLAATLATALAAGAQSVTASAGGPQEPALAPSAGAIITPQTPAPVATAWTAQQIDAAFIRADKNRDGGLSRAEVLAYTDVRLNFEDLDANKDGVLSRAEFEKGIR
ncbi:MAG: EF-hand domain-containing protein [Burkholderiaceae bacterium]|nr:EF-hand domain-containing protein [Burkholderiaceae bacterium]